jgi:flavin-dependent dehydrogenase
MLLAALNAGAHWLPGRLTSIERLQNLWRIQTNEGSVHSRYIIDASGRSSSVARKLGVQRVRDQELFAVYAWLEASSEDREMRTFIESTSQGWFYTSQLRDKTRIVGFHTDAATARDMVQDANVWRKLVNETKHIKQMIDDRSRLTKLHTTDASGARLEVFAGEGWIAAGDAALSFDPLSSQGIFNSIYTGMRAGESVHSALIQKTDFKDYVSELERIREVYSSRQSLYYSMEQRWLALPFWRMRAVQALEKGA